MPINGSIATKVLAVMVGFVIVGIAGIVAFVVSSENDAAATVAQHQAEDEQATRDAMSRPCTAAHPVFMMQPTNRGYIAPKRVARFDIMGVRLYQPPQVILEEVQKIGFFTAPPSIGLASCASDLIAADRIARNLDPGDAAPEAKTSCISSLSFANNNTTLTVSFSEDYPKQPGCVVSDNIELEEPGGNNAASTAAWEREVIKKYGKPDLDGFWNEDNDGPSLEDFSDANDFTRDLMLDDQSFTDHKKAAIDQAVSDDRPLVAPRL